MKDIETREDIQLLVSSFYEKVRANEEIGYFFNETIKDWDKHTEKLVDFWETNLLFVRKYKNNPFVAHHELDEKFPFEQYHFGIWLQLWFQNMDALFEGELAETAKRRARKMATFMYLNIFENRTK
ncbi:group III truncated hemoglobin [Aureivirga sp. CE67]|uniref:group III truncated hemoglobin n=1 Tax=Aureivirga sp. CE67 TaxID=1788983 RepID=UPI0018CB8E5E|nr:group III truncated hemoglobin [Aureivirga sp. CE67]